MSWRYGVSRRALNPWALAREVRTDADGALCLFVGTVRREGRGGKSVVRIEYEAYERMAVSEMGKIVRETAKRFRIGAGRIYQRLGRVRLGEPAIAIAVAAPHREDALAACKHLIDRIKETVPIWKKEVYEDGSEWMGDRS